MPDLPTELEYERRYRSKLERYILVQMKMEKYEICPFYRITCFSSDNCRLY
jgi:hypothetical protein